MKDARAEIIEVGRRLHERGLITAAEGNISVRSGRGMLITAGSVSKGQLTPELVFETDADGRPLNGGRVSSETPMHVAIYRRRPDVHAIVHAHPPAATAFAVAHMSLDQPLLAESVLLLGPVPLVGYAAPSTPALAENVAGAMGEGTHAALLANHGAVSVGESLALAHQRMETLEHIARVTLLARLLGRAVPLAAADVETLLRLVGGPYR
jgi:L-fuculose-phosphate aldolase